MEKLLSTRNYSLYTVPVAWWVCMGPHVYAILGWDHVVDKLAVTEAAQEGTGSNWKFDGYNPRTLLSRIETNPHPDLTTDVKARFRRAEAASQNGFENLGFFAASVVAANISLIVVHANEGQSLAKELLFVNTNSIGYLVCRVLFNVSYIRGSVNYIRGLWFYSALGCASALFIHAGNSLRHLVK